MSFTTVLVPSAPVPWGIGAGVPSSAAKPVNVKVYAPAMSSCVGAFPKPPPSMTFLPSMDLEMAWAS